MSEGWVGAIAGGIAVVLAGAVAAWINLRKSRAEIDKTARGDVLEEWREITNRLQERATAQEKELTDLREENTKLRGEMSALRGEIAILRTQIAARETERVQQRGEIRNLESVVSDLKKPDTQAIAEALAPKLADAIATQVAVAQLPLAAAPQPIPVQVVPAEDPLPVEVKVVLPKGMSVK